MLIYDFVQVAWTLLSLTKFAEMNEQTNKSKPGYPLTEKGCTTAKLSQGEKLQNLLDVEAAEGEVNTALCS